MRKSRIKTVVS